VVQPSTINTQSGRNKFRITKTLMKSKVVNDRNQAELLFYFWILARSHRESEPQFDFLETECMKKL